LTFTGRASNPLDRYKRFQITHPPFLDFVLAQGKFIIGLYIGKQGLESTYGAAASVVLILIWVYYTAQLVLMGAEFTNVYACRWGSKRGEAAARQRSDGKPADMLQARAA